MGTLRIIAGELRGRRIRLPDTAPTRPTADRVREALFSILGTRLTGARVLDAYAGSGALGFESLSRGARHVVMIESDPSALARLRDNATRLGLGDRCTLLGGRAVDLLQGSRWPPEPFDVVLADPPYASDEADRLLPAAAPRMAPDGVLVLERDSRSDPPEAASAGLECYRTARYGRTCLDFHRVAGDPDAAVS